MANLIHILGTESVQDPTKVEVHIRVHMANSKKFAKEKQQFLLAKLKKSPIDVTVSIRKRKIQKEAGNIRKRLISHSVPDFHRGKMCFRALDRYMDTT